MGNHRYVWAAVLGAFVTGIFLLLSILLGHYLSSSQVNTQITNYQQPNSTTNQSVPISNTNNNGACGSVKNSDLASYLASNNNTLTGLGADGTSWYRVEFWYVQSDGSNSPEYETWLSGGTWNTSGNPQGHVWFFTHCTLDQIKTDANDTSGRRNNAGVLDPSDSRVTSHFGS